MNTDSLKTQIDIAKKEFVTDGYSMSIGELVGLYKEGELIVNPNFQRKFRWSSKQQSRLIESILIGVPLPSIFVYQDKAGKWEVVDGLQRISTILSFMGELKNSSGEKIIGTTLEKTKLLPDLEGATWGSLPKEPFQLDFRRSKIELKIIKNSTDENAKLEVFQRLNYAPTILSGQEYRDAMLIMLNNDFYEWLSNLSQDNYFQHCIDLSDRWKDEKYDEELVLRLFTFSIYPISGYGKIDSYLDEQIFYDENSLLKRVSAKTFNLEIEAEKFKKTFHLLSRAKGDSVFQKSGKGQQFLESYYEAIGIGLYLNIDSYTEDDIELIRNKVDSIDNTAIKALNATSRISKTIPYGKEYFKK